MTTVGVLHPGDMGAALAARLRERGHDAAWAGEGRSAATRARAEAAGLDDAGALDALLARCAVVVSVCPPHAALDVARAVAGYGGVFVDANAVAPATAAAIGRLVEDGGARFVDGGIVGPPPQRAGTTRLYLSGAAAPGVAALLDGTPGEAPGRRGGGGGPGCPSRAGRRGKSRRSRTARRSRRRSSGRTPGARRR